MINYKAILIWFVLAFLIISCKGEKEDIGSIPPMTFPGDRWERRSPVELGVDSLKLSIALDTLKAYCGRDGVEEVVITRNGFVIYEGDSVTKSHGIWSSTKSFTSSILGLLYDKGIASPETEARSILPELAGKYPKLQLKHFLTHTSGYNAKGCNRWCDCCDEDWSYTMLDVSDPLFEPGAQFLYYDESMEMFSKVLTILTNESLESFIQRELLSKIGFNSFSWKAEYKTDTGIPICRGGSDIKTTALDLARLGHLYLNKGVWDEQRLIRTDWIEQATTNQVALDIAYDTIYRKATDGRGIYGYNFWVNGIETSGARSLTDAPIGTYYMSGYNNNMCFIIPEWNMVFVRMGLDGNPESKKVAYNSFFRSLGQAISVQ